MPKKILIVDDNPNVVMMTKSRLEANGYEVCSVLSGTEALKAAKELRPDVILLDLLIPDMQGSAVCAQLKNDAETSHIPIIAITAAPKRDLAVECVRAGAKTVLLQPYAPTALLVLIKKALDPESKWRRAENVFE